MNAYYRIYEDAPFGKFIALISYQTPVAWVSVDNDGVIECVVFSKQSHVSNSTCRHVRTFLSDVLGLNPTNIFPSKKKINSLAVAEVLYTYPNTFFPCDNGSIDEMIYAFGEEPFSYAPARFKNVDGRRVANKEVHFSV